MHLPIVVLNPAVIAGIILGLAALAYLVLALYFTWRFRERPVSVDGWRPPVSVLKPVHGAAAVPLRLPSHVLRSGLAGV